MPLVAMIWLKWVTMMLRILELDLGGGEVAVGADDLGEELRRLGDAHGVGSVGAEPHHAEVLVAAGDGVAGAPLQVGEVAGVDEVDLGLERRLEAVVPVLERGEERQVVGLELVEAGAEGVGDLALVDEDRGLALAHGELGAVLDGVALALEAPDDGVAGVVDPVDDVDELAAEEIEDRHGFSFSPSVRLSRKLVRDDRRIWPCQIRPRPPLRGADAQRASAGAAAAGWRRRSRRRPARPARSRAPADGPAEAGLRLVGPGLAGEARFGRTGLAAPSRHGQFPATVSVSSRRCAAWASRAISGRSGRTSSAVMPGRRRGS